MAMIKCIECGQDISDTANECIHCGCPVEKKITCSECGKELNNMDICCPNCGCPVNTKVNHNNFKEVKASGYGNYDNITTANDEGVNNMDGISVVNGLFELGKQTKISGWTIAILTLIYCVLGGIISIYSNGAVELNMALAGIGIGYFILSQFLPIVMYWMAHILLNLHQINENTKNSVNDKD